MPTTNSSRFIELANFAVARDSCDKVTGLFLSDIEVTHEVSKLWIDENSVFITMSGCDDIFRIGVEFVPADVQIALRAASTASTTFEVYCLPDSGDVNSEAFNP